MTDRKNSRNGKNAADKNGRDKNAGAPADLQFDFTNEMPAVDVDAMRAMSVKRHAKRRRTAQVAVSALVSGLLIVAVGVAAAGFVDISTVRDLVNGEGEETPVAYTQVVGRAESSVYCPQRMRLADTGTYGDQAYQVSEGDVSSRALIAATGSVSAAVVSPLSSQGSAVSIISDDSAPVNVLDTDQTMTTPLVATAAFDSSLDGTGLLGSVASWATEGDLQGLSAVSCVAAASSQRIIVPSTRVGWTQQLVIANPSTSSTVVSLTAWGTAQQGEIGLSTDARVAVPAGGESVVNLAAAADGEEAVVVDVVSDSMPVAVVARSVFVDGLQPRGSEYVTSTVSAATSQIIGALGDSSQSVELTLFTSVADTEAKVLWVTESGRQMAQKIPVQAGRVSVTELTDRPDGAYALVVEADQPVNAQVMNTQEGGRQSDFSISQTVLPSRVAGLTVPSGLDGDIIVGNETGSAATIRVTARDAAGNTAGERTLSVRADSAARLSLADLTGGTVSPLVITATCEGGDGDDESGEGIGVTLAARLTQPDVEAASLQGASVIAGASLDSQTGSAVAVRDQRIIG